MTAPGGSNFFSKSQRRAAKATAKADSMPTEPEGSASVDGGSFTIVNLPDRDAKAKEAVAEAETANRKKYGK